MVRAIDFHRTATFRVALVAALLCAALATTAQEAFEDFGVWIAGEYETELFPDLDLAVEQEFRLEDNARTLGRMHTNIGLGYKLYGPLRLGANYRFISNRRGNGFFAYRHRATADLILRERYRRWRFTYRGRIQWDFKGYGYGDEMDMGPARKFRNKFQLQFQVDRRTAVYGDFNVRAVIFDPGEPSDEWYINRFRYRAGLKYMTSEYGSVNLFFQHDRDVNIAEPEHLYIVGVGFGFENWKPLFR